MPETAARWGLSNSFEPMEAIAASATLLGHLARAFGNLGLAAAYNAGERRVEAYLAGRSGLPFETRDYVASITGVSARAWKEERHKVIDFKLDAARPFGEACVEFPVLKASLKKAFANTYFNRGLALTAKGVVCRGDRLLFGRHPAEVGFPARLQQSRHCLSPDGGL